MKHLCKQMTKLNKEIEIAKNDLNTIIAKKEETKTCTRGRN